MLFLEIFCPVNEHAEIDWLHWFGSEHRCAWTHENLQKITTTTIFAFTQFRERALMDLKQIIKKRSFVWGFLQCSDTLLKTDFEIFFKIALIFMFYHQIEQAFSSF